MRALSWSLAAIILAAGILTPAAAAAATAPNADTHGAIIFYKYGEMAFETGPLPEPYNTKKGLEGFKAGYLCKVFAIFWAYIHKWKCKPVAFKGNTYLDETKPGAAHIKVLNQAIAKKYSMGDIKLGFWAKHGRWILLLILLGAVGFGIFKKVRAKDDD